MLNEANEVVVDLAGNSDHVVVGVVEDWVEYTSVILKMSSSVGWPLMRGWLSAAFLSTFSM